MKHIAMQTKFSLFAFTLSFSFALTVRIHHTAGELSQVTPYCDLCFSWSNIYSELIYKVFFIVKMNGIQSSNFEIGMCSSSTVNSPEARRNSRNVDSSKAKSPSKKRMRREIKSPQRYGDIGLLDFSDSFEEYLNLADNSFDDKNYEPPEEPMVSSEKIVARITKPIPGLHRAKKAKSNEAPSQSRFTENNVMQRTVVSNKADNLATIVPVNFDAEFDALTDIAITNSDIMAISDSMCDNMLGSDENKLNSVQGKKTTDVDQHSVDTVEMCKKLLLEFRQYAKESLARISIIEEAMIKNGTLSHHMNKSKAAETIGQALS